METRKEHHHNVIRWWISDTVNVPVELVEAEWRGHLVHVLPAVLPHHLAAIVVELAVGATTEEGGH